MTPLGEILREMIRREGPIEFRRFMELALYHPEHGYYRRGRDPFGRAGDYFTAEQLQPVFGILVARLLRGLGEQLGRPEDFTVVELGAGRREMAEAFAAWRYVAVEVGEAPPEAVTGVVFANEFFDALPVDQAVRRAGRWRLMRVGWEGERFVWVEGEPVEGAAAEYLERYAPFAEEGSRAEVHLEALQWMERIARILARGFLLAMDYGYTRREAVRFPEGTLMSYRRHRALEDVLEAPGETDITSHVPFSALIEHGEACGLETLRLERLGRMLLEAGEADGFAEALQGEGAERLRRALQLKTLLFAMGESFYALLARKKGAGNEKGPESLGA